MDFFSFTLLVDRVMTMETPCCHIQSSIYTSGCEPVVKILSSWIPRARMKVWKNIYCTWPIGHAPGRHTHLLRYFCCLRFKPSYILNSRTGGRFVYLESCVSIPEILPQTLGGCKKVCMVWDVLTEYRSGEFFPSWFPVCQFPVRDVLALSCTIFLVLG